MRRAVILILLVMSAGLLVYPSFAACVSDYRQTMIVRGYTGDMQLLPEGKVFSLKDSAAQYNKMIFEQQKSKPFRYTGESYDDPLYDAQLISSELSSVMGYIEIVSTGAYVPIVHGTRSEDLTFQAGHLYGTSLPWGGPDSHSVLSAHTGLVNARLFDGLDGAEAGELVKIHVLDEIHIYTIKEKHIVLPNDADIYLQIEKGRDLLTLYTCTPPGINSHRLLVRCERTGTVQTESVSGSDQADIRDIKALLKAIMWALIPLAVLIIGILVINRSRNKDKRPKS